MVSFFISPLLAACKSKKGVFVGLGVSLPVFIYKHMEAGRAFVFTLSSGTVDPSKGIVWEKESVSN